MYILGSLVVPPRRILVPNSPVGVQPVSSALIFLRGSSRNTVIAWSYHSDEKEKLIPNSPVGVQPVSSAVIFSPGEQQKHCHCLVVPQRRKGKINSQLTGWSPTGEFGINFSPGEQQKHCHCLVVPQRQKGKINSQLTGWSPTGEFGINFLSGGAAETLSAGTYHSDKKEKLIPNSPVGVQPVSSALIFSPGEQQKHCPYPCRVLPQRQKGKINSQLTGWSPTGEFGINFFSGGAAETLSLPGRTTATKRKYDFPTHRLESNR